MRNLIKYRMVEKKRDSKISMKLEKLLIKLQIRFVEPKKLLKISL